MVPPSIFILLSALSACHLSLTESIGTGGIVNELPNELTAEQLLLQSQEIQELANQLALNYLYDGDPQTLSNLDKRTPGSDTVDKKDTISSMHRVFAREGIPPNLLKLSYGKRGNDKRSMGRFYFGKREHLVTPDKRAYSKFMFGKRGQQRQQSTVKRAGYSPFMFGKREDLVETLVNSALPFDKRVPEMAKRAHTGFYFGKRGGQGEYSKFVFGKRDGDDLEMDTDV